MQDFVETDCTVIVDGKSFAANGASLVDGRLTAYLDVGGALNDWKGNRLGDYKIVRTWNTPKSYVSDTMHQVVAKVDGVFYTGRSAGVQMIFNGKRKAKQSWW